MATTNYTTITSEQIDNSLGRNTFNGEQGTVYLSKHSDDSFMTNAGEVLSIRKALDLILDGKVWGMNDVAEEAIREAFIKTEVQSAQEEVKRVKAATAFNYSNLQNLVTDGSIFYVEFIKRTNGERRKMRCRTGAMKHLKGGKRTYSAASKGLLSVFDMNARGYRSIPVDAIQALTVNGQSFNFAEV